MPYKGSTGATAWRHESTVGAQDGEEIGHRNLEGVSMCGRGRREGDRRHGWKH
jgi:hypothetical protein